MPEPEDAVSHAALEIEGLNPAFLRGRGIVPLNRTGAQLTVGCARGLTDEDRAALEFATGLEIRIAEWPKQKIEAYLAELAAAPERPDTAAARLDAAAKRGSGQAPVVPDQTGQISLMDLFGARLHRFSRSYAPFAPLAQLLEAGYSPREAGEVLVKTDHPAQLPGPACQALAMRLAAGTTLGEAVEQDADIPRWLRSAIAACHSEAGQIGAFVRLTAFDRTMSIRSAETARQRLESAVLWLAAAVAWFVLATSAGLFVAAFALAGVIWFRDLSAPHHRTDAMRARVLGMLEVAASLDLSPSAAIRVSMASLDAVSPTWGALPDTREGLADALALPPFSRALLMKGTLGQAAGLAASEHSMRSVNKLARCRWLNSRAAMGLFAGALAALAVQ